MVYSDAALPGLLGIGSLPKVEMKLYNHRAGTPVTTNEWTRLMRKANPDIFKQ
jgi:hypothetical protein